MRNKFWLSTALAFGLIGSAGGGAEADTLRQALAKSYSNNQELNAARAQLRATDENVTQARSRLRPFVTASGGVQASRSRVNLSDNRPNVTARAESLGAGIEIGQILFDGFQTTNNVNAAQAEVRAGQANLANTVQNILVDTVTVFMDVRRDRQIAAFREQNLAAVRELVRSADARFEVGEGTRTDVAQAQSEEAFAIAQLNSALAEVAVSESTYLEVVGDVPGTLEPGTRPPENVLPSAVGRALEVSQAEHPAIQAALFAVEAASFQVKAAEGSLLPELSVSASIDNTYSLSEQSGRSSGAGSGGFEGLPGVNPNVLTQNELTGTVGATLTIPIYQGGLNASQVRQAKQVLGQRRIEVDNIRDQVRQLVAASYAQLQAAEANVTGFRAQVAAAELALGGVTEERAVGQRTTLDVLNAQAEVINSQILLAGSQRDVVVAAYTLLGAVGRFDAVQLGLNAEIYDPNEHYDQVQDRWYGLRTPDGR